VCVWVCVWVCVCVCGCVCVCVYVCVCVCVMNIVAQMGKRLLIPDVLPHGWLGGWGLQARGGTRVFNRNA